MNHHILSLQAMSSTKDPIQITLEDATLHERKIELAGGMEQEIKEDLAKQMLARVKKLDKAFDNGDHDPSELISIQVRLLLI